MLSFSAYCLAGALAVRQEDTMWWMADTTETVETTPIETTTTETSSLEFADATSDSWWLTEEPTTTTDPLVDESTAITNDINSALTYETSDPILDSYTEVEAVSGTDRDALTTETTTTTREPLATEEPSSDLTTMTFTMAEPEEMTIIEEPIVESGTNLEDIFAAPEEDVDAAIQEAAALAE